MHITKRLISLILCVALLIGLLPANAFGADQDADTTSGWTNFVKQKEFSEETFSDVDVGDWHYENVKSTYQFGLMIGNSATTFNPEGYLSIAQAVTVAVRIHAIYHLGTADFVQGKPWYQVYVDYAKQNNIISEDYPNYNSPATRAEVAMLLAKSFPESAVQTINYIADDSIPDVKIDEEYGTAVYSLYRFGILTGKNATGAFFPDQPIKRGELAAIASRIIDISLRKTVDFDCDRTVFFNGNGENVENLPEFQVVKLGDCAKEPDSPVREGYEFVGWYYDSTCTKSYHFDTPIEMDLALYAGWMKRTVIDESHKENRRIDLDLSESFDLNLIDIDSLVWSFSAAAPAEKEQIRVDENTELSFRKSLIISEEGEYCASVMGRKINGERISLQWNLNIAEDIPPIAGFSAKSYLVEQNRNGIAVINLEDASYSEDMDEIGSRTWSVRFDSDNDGDFSDEKVGVFQTGNREKVTYFASEIGKYEFTLDVTESYAHTIPYLLPEDAFLTASTAQIESIQKIVEVTYHRYTVSFDGNGDNVENIPEAQRINEGCCANMPSSPERVGYGFTGWYTNRACTSAFDFDSPIEDDLTLYAGWMKQIVVEESYKENRRIDLDLSKSFDLNQIDTDSLIWSFTAVAPAEKEQIRVDKNIVSHMRKSLIISEEGVYFATVTGRKKNGEKISLQWKLNIAEDLPPVADFTAKSYLVEQNRNGIAVINLEDASSSPDSDEIGSRIWSVRFDSDNDGDFSDEEVGVFQTGNKENVVYFTDKVGQYEFTLDVTESYDHTIPYLLPEDAFRSASSSQKIVEVTHHQYTLSFNVNGENVENIPEAQKISAGSCATVPDNPERAGYSFTGWYTNRACTSAFDFATPIEDDLTLYAGWMKQIVVEESYKENRRIDLDLSKNFDLNQIDIESLAWSFTAVAPADEEQIRVDENSISNIEKSLIISKEGEYRVTVTGRTKNGNVLNLQWKINIIKDLPPIAGFFAKSYLVERNKNRIAAINLEDTSYSADGDEIGSRTWSVRFDSDNDGDFSDEEVEVFQTGNKEKVVYFAREVGKYEFQLDATEAYHDTIFYILPENAFRSAPAPRKIVEVTYHQFTVSFDGNGEDVENLPEAQKVCENCCAVIPDSPERAGYAFSYWYTDAACKNVFDFDTPIEDDLTLYAGWIKQIVVEESYKENRRIDLDLSKSFNLYQIDTDSLTWHFTAIAPAEEDQIKIDNTTSNTKKSLIISKPGLYRVSVSGQAKSGEDIYCEALLTIVEDLPPVAGFMTEYETVERNADGIAPITLNDISYSPDGDDIGSRIWFVKFDSDNDGDFSNEEAKAFEFGNLEEVTYSAASVGKYEFELVAAEYLDDTIPSLLEDDAYRAASSKENPSVRAIVEVDNHAPESLPGIRKAKEVDLVMTVGNALVEDIDKQNESMQEITDELRQKGYDVKLSTVSTSTLTAKDTFAWKEYDHYNYSDRYLPTLAKHILYEENAIRMVGYSVSPLRDWLFVDEGIESQVNLSFDMIRDRTDWHSIEGGGFLFNTTIGETTMSGYCILLVSSGFKLIQFTNLNVESFRNGGVSGTLQNAGKVLLSIPVSNVYDSFNVRIVADKRIISVFINDAAVIENFVLPVQNTGTGFGPIVCHGSHSCSQQSYYTFSNIRMSTIQGDNLGDVLNDYPWRPSAEHYVVNLSSDNVYDLADEMKIAGAAQSIIENEINFIGIGTANAKAQYRSLLKSADGVSFDLYDTYKDEDLLKNYLLNQLNAVEYEIADSIVTTADKLDYTNNYFDKENDPTKEQVWKYMFDASTYENSSGTDSEFTTAQPLTSFDATGTYKISSQVRDDPTGNNENLAAYSKWSEECVWTDALRVHCRPVAAVSHELFKTSDVNEFICNLTFEGTDLDGLSQENQGIVAEEFEWKCIDDDSWTTGTVPKRVQAEKVYLQKYRVQDAQGAWSAPCVHLICAEKQENSGLVVDNEPPKVSLSVSDEAPCLGDAVSVSLSATDNVEITYLYMKLNGRVIWGINGESQQGRSARIACNEVGEQVLTVECGDIGGNTIVQSIVLHVTDKRDIIAPTIEIDTENGVSVNDRLVKIQGSITDDVLLSRYTVKYAPNGSEDYTPVKEAFAEVINGEIVSFQLPEEPQDTYNILFEAYDAAGNKKYETIVLTITKESSSIGEQTEEEEINDQTDRIAPVIAIDAENGVQVSDQLVKIQGSITDDVLLRDYTVKYALSGSEDYTSVKEAYAEVVNGEIASFRLPDDAQGSYEILIEATDAAGNMRRNTLILTITQTSSSIGSQTEETKIVEQQPTDELDRIAPVITIDAENGLQFSDQFVEIRGSITDDVLLRDYTVKYAPSGSEDYTSVKEASAEVVNGEIASFRLPDDAQGSYEILIEATDAAGNIKRNAIVLTIRKASGNIIEQSQQSEIAELPQMEDHPAEITLEASPLIAEISDSVTVNVDADDADGLVQLKTYKDNVLVFEGIGQIRFSETVSKTVTIKTVAVDANGNEYEKSIIISFADSKDYTLPTADIRSPELGATVSGQVSVIGSAMDENSLRSYVLEYKNRTERDYHTITSSYQAVDNGELGLWDTYPLVDGIYELHLVVTDSSGNMSGASLECNVRNENALSNEELAQELIAFSKPDNNMIVDQVLSIVVQLDPSATDGEFMMEVKKDGAANSAAIPEYELDSSAKKITATVDTALYDNGKYTLYLATKLPDGRVARKEVHFYVQHPNLVPTSNQTCKLLSPGEMDELTEKTAVKANISSSFTQYKLAYSVAGHEDYVLIAQGDVASADEILGYFDPTLLKNGYYDIQLTAIGKGIIATDLVTVNVSGNMKIGNFSLSFADLDTNVRGVPVSVIRTYDSRTRNTSGDFGFGWDMSFTDVTLDFSSKISENWYSEVSASSGLFPISTYSIRESKAHRISVNLGNGMQDEFAVQPSPFAQAFSPIRYFDHVDYIALNRSKATLQPVHVNKDSLLFVNDIIYTIDYSTGMEPYEPQQYIYTTEDGTKYWIDVKEGLQKIVTMDGEEITFTQQGIDFSSGKSIRYTRDEAGRVTAITNDANETITYEYDIFGDLVSTTDLNGNQTRFVYQDHYLTETIDPRGIMVSRNEYDDDGRLVKTIDANGNEMVFEHNLDGREELITDRNGGITRHIYDKNGNVLSTTDQNGNTVLNTYDENGNISTKTDAMGNVTQYQCNDSGEVLSMTDAEGYTVTNSYNSKGMLTSIQAMGISKMQITYDEKGNATETTDAMGNSVYYQYDNKGQMRSVTDAIGTYCNVTYDANGNVISSTDGIGTTTTYTYDEAGHCLSETTTYTSDGESQTLTEYYTYDKAGNVLTITDNEGHITAAEYNSIGKVSATIDEKSRKTTYDYDYAGNLTKISYADGTFETFTYDREGNNLTATDRSGITVTMAYDKVGNLTELAYPTGAKITYSYDKNYNLISETKTYGDEEAVTTYEYDRIGRNTAIIDAFGNEMRYAYDSNSQLASITDAKGNVYQYTYDLNGNQIKTTYPDGESIQATYDARARLTSQTDQNGYTTLYQYDGNDNLTSVTDALGNVTSYTYNEVGNLVTVTDAKGQQTHYSYDKLGRVIAVTNPAGQSAQTAYDECGNVVSATDYAGKLTTFAYDEFDRVTSKTTEDQTITYQYTTDGKLAKVTDKTGTTAFTYGSMGELSKVVYPDGKYIAYTYDAWCRLTGISTANGTTAYSYDIMDRLTRVVDRNGDATEYEYDVNGNRAKTHYANGIDITYDYDKVNRLILERGVNSTGEVILQYEYTLGKAGERLAITELDQNVEYSYDALYRLVSEKITDHVDNVTEKAYAYDAVSNRISKTENGQQTVAAYNNLNQLVSEDEKEYQYDDAGNLISVTAPSGSVHYSYDSENRLIRAAVQNGANVSIEEYSYDFAGNRTEKKSEGGYTRYLNDISGSLSYVIEEYNVRSEETCHYTWGAELISQERSKNTSYYLCDGHNSVRLLADESGSITDTYTFDAWGNLLSSTGDTENCFLYCGEQMDATTGLYYLRARYMNPGTGTFLTMDTYPASIFEPATLHRYLYANANPVSYVDPSGYNPLLLYFTASKIIESFLLAVISFVVLISLVQYTQSLVDQYNSKFQIEFYHGANSYESVGETTATIEGTLEPPIPWVDIPKTRIPGIDIPGSLSESFKYILFFAAMGLAYKAVESSKVETQEQKVSYWTATIIAGQVTPIDPLSYSDAQDWVAKGGDLLCINLGAAFAIIKFWPSAIWEPAHHPDDPNYLPHFHLSSAHENHIWYLP